MTDITNQDFENVLGNILSNAKAELISKVQSDLENYWYFEYDITKSKEWNLYLFTKALDIYKSNCRQWEEHHNGYSCVVERVRDQYLMPKIKQFIKDIDQ